RPDAFSERILRLLREKYLPRHPKAEFSVFRSSPANVHIRILDPDVRGVDIPERDDMAWEVLDELPDEVVSDISVVLLLPPEDRDAYELSREFDTPTRSRVKKNA